MTYGAFIFIIVISTAMAVLFSYIVHRLVHVDTRRRHQEVGTSVFLQLGVLFAVLLAFVFSEAYGEYGEAQRAIDLECSALHGAAMYASTLPPDEARGFLMLEAAYVRDVLNYDWPEMRDHKLGSPQAVLSMTALFQFAAHLPVRGTDDAAVKAQLLQLLAQAHTQREERLFQAQNGLPVIIWIVLIAFGVLLMVFVTFSGVERYLWLIMFVMTFSICVSATLGLVGLLNYPFQGAIALTPQDFMLRLSDMNSLIGALDGT